MRLEGIDERREYLAMIFVAFKINYKIFIDNEGRNQFMTNNGKEKKTIVNLFNQSYISFLLVRIFYC